MFMCLCFHVQVHGKNEDIKPSHLDTIVLYFENERSGGGVIEQPSPIVKENCVIIQFKDVASK